MTHRGVPDFDELADTPEERSLVEASRAEFARTGKCLSQEAVEALVRERRRREIER